MVKIKKEDSARITRLLERRGSCMDVLMDEIRVDQGLDFATQMALVGMDDLAYLYGMISMYFIIKDAIKRAEVEGLEGIYRMNEGEDENES